ncbi:MAG: universal stress protein [Vulcanimicrobiaceae bacterium]
MNEVHPHEIGIVVGLLVLVAIAATLYWMLHPPTTSAEQAASATERDLEEIIGSIIIVFSEEIHSEHMLALAARLARKERAVLLAAYVIEVPHTLPIDAAMESEHREALRVMQIAETIGRKNNLEIATEIVSARQVSQGVLELAKRKDAHLIVLGSYREGKYAGAPLGRAIEVIAAHASCDVLIGIQGIRGKILTPPPIEKVPAAANGERAR